jgi:nitrogen fixation NifU-like protein
MIDQPIDDLYREVILDHHRHPRGDRPLDHPDIEASGRNPACGDEVTLQMSFAGDRISGVGVLSRGCAISTSSGSMLAELVEGRTLAEAERIAQAFRALMHDEPGPDAVDLGDLEALEGVRRFPVRVKCALLPWITLLDALLAKRQGRRPHPVSTEGVAADGRTMEVGFREAKSK